MTFFIILFLLLLGFALGWRARDIKQDQIDGVKFWEDNEKPCDEIHVEYGLCQETGKHTMHKNGLVSWFGSVQW